VRLPDGREVQVKKFAPMGSAVCFPVQCIIFTAVVLLAYLYRFYGTGPEGQEPFRGCLRDYNSFFSFVVWAVGTDFRHYYTHTIGTIGVYGDDIICDTRATADVISILEDLGFQINLPKSFGGEAAFRESCGMYSLGGSDVTPYILKLPPLPRRWDAKTFASLVELANRAGDFSYLHLQSFIINTTLRKDPPKGCKLNPIPFQGFGRKLSASSAGIRIMRIFKRALTLICNVTR
jgi:hypothetical protein